MMQQLWVAQAAIPAQEYTLFFLSGPQFFIALIAGVVMAFAFQVVLTNFLVATDISAGTNPFETDSKSLGKQIRTIEARVGAGTIFIVNIALFLACFLAVKLTFIQESSLGAIVGIVIWSAYFLLLLWSGSRAVGSLVGAVGSTATSGVQGVMATIATALSGRAASSQIVNTVEASVEAVTKQLKAGLSSEQVRENLENYVKKIQLPQGDLKDISGQILQLLNQTNSLTSSNPSDLLNFIKSATPEELRSGQLGKQLTQLLGTVNNQGKESASLRDRALQYGFDSLLATLSKRADLSDLDLEAVTGQLNSFRQQLAQQANQAVDAIGQLPKFSPIRSDIENYILNSPFWYLRPEGLDRGFREVLFDPSADPGLVRQQLEQFNRQSFVDILTRRPGITPEQVNDIADELELIRQEVLDRVHSAEEQERTQELRHQVETYLKSAPKEALTAEQIQTDFAALLADPEASYETLGNRLLQFDRDTLLQLLLAGRQDLSQEEAEQILTQLIQVRDRFLNQSQETWNQLQSQASEFQQRVESYLRDTQASELTATGIQQSLQALVEAPEAGLLAVRTGLGQFNRQRLQELLTQRQDLNPEQVNRLIDQFETVRHTLVHAPQELAGQAREQYDRLLGQIADYLRQTNLTELNPEGIQRDLQTLLADPQAGTVALRRRLSQVDRDTLVTLLSQRGDLSEQQLNQIIDQVQSTLRNLVRAPQRLASRSRDRLRDLPQELADYLRHTQREELNPEGIKRDLQLLLKQPGAGFEQLKERFSQIDRESLVALLSQRQDMTETEASQIIDQIEAVRDQVLQPVQKAQSQVQSLVDSSFERLRTYLNSLEQPELNYEGIQRDLRRLFDDPEAGFEALQERLGQFDRETLVALLSSRRDISEQQANQIVDQIEAARDSVLHRAERLQAEAEKRIQALKHQAKEQLQETQKVVATAAWWLFGTALTSVASAAIAGILAVRGFNFWS
mgnify:CR=1 FL=1